MSKRIDFRPVILAGGSGTRFWPRSRRARAKQVLALDGERSMIQQTVERLKPLAGLDQHLGHHQRVPGPGNRRPVARACPPSRSSQEPVARNTAPACGLAAFLIERQNPDAVLGVFPSDHVICRRAPLPARRCRKASPWPPPATTWWCWASSPPAPKPATATSRPATSPPTTRALHVRRFIEKPNQNQGRGVCRRRQLLLELGHVPVVGAHPGQRRPRAPAGNRAAAGEHRRRLRHPRVREVFRELYPQVREHLRRLRRAGAALGQGRTPLAPLLPARRVQLERPRLLGLALRVPAGNPPARRRRRQRGRDRRPHRHRRRSTTTSTAPRNLWRWWACRTWSSSIPRMRC